MHPNDETLRAYLDDELAPAVRASIQEHTEACPGCVRRLSELRSAADLVAPKIAALGPAQGISFSPQRALNQFYRRKKEPSMKNIFRRPVWAAAALVAMIAVAMAFPPVRALAGSFLGLFRVQQVRVISFDPSALDKYNGVMQSNNEQFQAYFKQYLTITHQGVYQEARTKLAASRMAGFSPRLPAGAQVSSLGVNPGETATLVIDSATMNTFLKALDRTDVSIPSNLDGQQIKVTVPASVSAQFGNCPESAPKTETGLASPVETPGCSRLIQLASPTVQAPDSFPVIQLGESMFQLLGMSPDQAKQLSQSIDWASTLVIPVPAGKSMTVTQVSVDGVNGNLVSGGQSQQYTLVWIKNGVVYALTGNGDTTEALKLANTLE